MTYTHIVHLGDIHIRCGKEEHSRFNEYVGVFEELERVLKGLPCVRDGTAMIVVCGDIFHHKYKLEAYSILLWNRMMEMLTALAPVVVICGNHDYRQEDPETPDLIEVMFQSVAVRPSAYPCHYLKQTGTYVFDSIEFGLVSIKDTLNAFNTQGIVESLPAFPKPSHPDCVSVALFHGTITQSALPNGQVMSAGKGYPLEWFKGYDLLLLGDNHKQQIHQSTWGLRWGYPGSLVQQDIGEPVHGHGFLLWDLATKQTTPFHIYNPFGRLKVRLEASGGGSGLGVKVWPVGKFEPLETVMAEPWFPKEPHCVYVGAMADEWKVVDKLKEIGIQYRSIQATSTVQMNGDGGDSGGEASISDTLTTIHRLNHPTMWMDYIRSKDATMGNIIDEEGWIGKPEKLLVDCVPLGVSKELHELTVKYRHSLEKNIQNYERTTEEIRQQRHRVVLKHMSWDWVYSYGAKNHFEFGRLEGGVGLLNGKNASGKSAFIDALCIGLFGEPSLNRQLNQTKKMDEHCIHSNRPKGTHVDRMNVKIRMMVDEEVYELERHYKQSVAHKEAGGGTMELFRVEGGVNGNEREMVRSGTTLVNEWVKQHIGTIEDLMKTSIVCQMDNNNFFFAKPDEQKAMIDSAVNLKELQAYSELIHESLLQYQNLLKTVSTILQVAEEYTIPVMSEEGRRLKENELKQLSDVCRRMEEQKETYFASVGAFPVNALEPEADAEAESLEYWERRLPTDPHWKENLAERRHQASLLDYELTKLGLTTEDTERYENDPRPLGKLEKTYAKHVTKKPPSSRSVSLLHRELETLREWMDAHRSWIDTMDSHSNRVAAAKETLERLEREYAFWVKKEPVTTESEGEDAEEGNDTDDWVSNVEAFEATRRLYEEREAMKKALGRAYWFERPEDWCRAKAAYEERVAECQANDWTEVAVLEENRRATRAYLEKRRLLNGEKQGVDSQMKECQRTLEKHGDWKAHYSQWKDQQALLKTMSKESLDAKMDRWDSSNREKLALVERMATIEKDPWWDEWNQWTKKRKRCEKQKWLTVAEVQSELADYEAEKQRFVIAQRDLEMAVRERDGLQHGNPHPDCSVCQARLGECQARIDACRECMGEWTLEKLEAMIAYYQKGLAAIQWVETLAGSMTAKHERYETERRECRPRIDALDAVLASIAIDDVRRERQWYETIAASAGDLEKYEWLETMDDTYRSLKKQSKKLEVKLASMQSEEELTETEHYWQRAVDVCSKVAYETPGMERAKEYWVDIESKPMVTKEQFTATWRVARRAWRTAGERIQRLRKDAKEEIDALVAFERHWETQRSQEDQLRKEMEWAEAGAEWERSVAELQRCILCKKRRQCAADLETLEGYERADQWVKWYDYKDIQKTLELTQLNCQALREELAIDDDHCERNGGRGGGTAGGDGGHQGSNRALLKSYQTKWTNVIEILTVLDTYLVGEKGKQKKTGTAAGAGAGAADTFKEWVYQHHILPLLEEHINVFLKSVGVDLRFRIGYGKKALSYTVIDRGNTTSFAASSGFQQFIIGLGMRHALGSVGGTGNNLQHLFIDEGFTACDAENLEKSFDILQRLISKGHYKSILLISHLEPIQEMVSLKIPLVRRGCFTQLTFGEPYPVSTDAVKRKGRPPKQR